MCQTRPGKVIYSSVSTLSILSSSKLFNDLANGRLFFSFGRFERVLGLCADILKRNIQLYHSFVSLSVQKMMEESLQKKKTKFVVIVFFGQKSKEGEEEEAERGFQKETANSYTQKKRSFFLSL